MKTVFSLLFAALISFFSISVYAETPKQNNSSNVTNSTNGVYLELYYQGGSGLINSIEVGDKSIDGYAMKVYLASGISHIRIDWRLDDGGYYPSTYVTGGGNTVTIPQFSTNHFVITAEYSDYDFSSGSIYKTETRRYYVRGI